MRYNRSFLYIRRNYEHFCDFTTIFKLTLIVVLRSIASNGQLFLQPLPPYANHIHQSQAYLPSEARHHSGHHSGHPSECAVILQRTYVDTKHDLSYAPPYAGFFNLFKGHGDLYDDDHSHHKELCIRYSDVNRAIKHAMRKLRYKRPKEIDSLEPPPDAIAVTAEVTLAATHMLAQKFSLSHDEIMNGLPLIDMSRTIFWDHCPLTFKPIPCPVSRYRTYTAHCNNLKHPSWGAANTPFVRYIPNVYSDGIEGERKSVIKGAKLPNVRLVSQVVHHDHDQPGSDLTILIMSWGQFIDHDLALAAPPRMHVDGQETDFNCCQMSDDEKHAMCHTFDMPDDDPLYGEAGQKCHDFKRSLAGHRPHCALGPRVHVNQLTAPIDANFVYGSTAAMALRLREFKGGLMKVWDRFHEYGLKPLLPPEKENPELDCIGRPKHLYCFIAGDVRVNEQIHLTVLHTFYVRDHNRMAVELGRLNPHWDDEKIYQETRHIMAAMTQHITLNEFLPLLIGEELMHRHNLTEEQDGYWNGYDPHAHTAPAQGFTTAAFRQGHTFIQGLVRRYNKYHEFLGHNHLRHLLRQPFIVYEPGKMDELAIGMLNTPAQTYDPFITVEVSGHLFQEIHAMVGMDLPAINLARGREQGVPGYNTWREWCGLPRAESFEDLAAWLNNKTAYHYSKLYAHPDDIDLWSGGISERILPGAIIGPTFACIIARNFANIRKGDRFWFENSGWPSAFTPDQLHQIKKSTQAKIMCENGDDIPTIQMWVLRQAHPIFNPRVKCEDLPYVDLSYWQEDPINGGYHFRR